MYNTDDWNIESSSKDVLVCGREQGVVIVSVFYELLGCGNYNRSFT